MTCHNLLKRTKPSLGTTQLLGHGLNFCAKSASTNEMITNTFRRLAKDVRRIYALREEKEGGYYIPAIYIKSKYVFDPASEDIEDAMSNFKAARKRKWPSCGDGVPTTQNAT